jgi:hypothetical protein
MNTKVSNNYKGIDIEVRPNSIIKLTRELEPRRSETTRMGPLIERNTKTLNQLTLRTFTLLKDTPIAFSPESP